MDPVVLELCRLRVAQLVGCDGELAVRSRPAVDGRLAEDAVAELASWPTAARFDDTTRACLGFTEQFVIDPVGDQRRRPGAGAHGRADSPGWWDWPRRWPPSTASTASGRCSGSVPTRPPTAGGGATVVDVGEPDPSVPAVGRRRRCRSRRSRPEGSPPPSRASSPRSSACTRVLWSGGVVDHPSKEVARLRNARVTGCKFCRNVRFARARHDGLTEDLVDLVADGYETTALSDAHKAVIALTDAFLGDPGRRPDDGDQRGRCWPTTGRRGRWS